MNCRSSSQRAHFPSPRQQGDISTPVRFHIHSPSFFFCEPKSQHFLQEHPYVPFSPVDLLCHIFLLCFLLLSYLLCLLPQLSLPRFLALVAYIISPGVLEMWGSGRYSSELQFDDRLNSASSTPWGCCKAVVTEHFCFQFPVCLLLLPAFSFHAWRCNFYAFVSEMLKSYGIVRVWNLSYRLHSDSLQSEICNFKRLAHRGLSGVVRSPADCLNKPSLQPKIFTLQWQAHAWFESVTQSQPRCQTNNFQ